MTRPRQHERSFAISRKRWDAAQEHEKGFWQRGESWENEFERVRNRYGPLLASIDAGLPATARILDLGCGPTCAGRLFTKEGRFFLDPLMEAFEERWASRMPPGARVAAAGETLPFEDQSLDVVICFNALDHMLSPETVLMEIRRVLRPAGSFVLGLFCHPPVVSASRALIERVLPFLKDTPHPFSFTTQSAERLLSRHFTVETARCVFSRPGMLSFLHRCDWVFCCRPRAAAEGA